MTTAATAHVSEPVSPEFQVDPLVLGDHGFCGPPVRYSSTPNTHAWWHLPVSFQVPATTNTQGKS